MSSKSNIVLISGGNTGIGLATAKRLASENPGYHAIIGSRNALNGTLAANHLSSQGLSVSSIQLDVTDDASIAAAVSHVESTYGRLDVLINNAAVMLDGFVPDLSTRALFTQTFGPNVIGAACLTSAFLPLLQKSSLPRVVFVSSRLGSLALSKDPTTPFYADDFKAYQASKAALNMLAINYSVILDKVGGKVNAVCPGLVATKLTEYIEGGATPDVGAIRVVQLATMGREGETATFSDRAGPVPW